MRVGLITANVHAREGKIRHKLAVLSDRNLVLGCTIHALVQLRDVGVEFLKAFEGALLEDLGGTGALNDEEPAHQVLKKAHQCQEEQPWFLLLAAGEEAVLVHVGGHGAPEGTVGRRRDTLDPTTRIP